MSLAVLHSSYIWVTFYFKVSMYFKELHWKLSWNEHWSLFYFYVLWLYLQKTVQRKRHNSQNFNYYTGYLICTYPLPMPDAHFTLILLGKMGLSLHKWVMLTGRGGLLGSTPGLLVGIGFGRVAILPLIATQTLGGNSSDISLPCSNVNWQNRSCI